MYCNYPTTDIPFFTLPLFFKQAIHKATLLLETVADNKVASCTCT